MKISKTSILLKIFILAFLGQKLIAQSLSGTMQEPYRPQIHFTPKAHWMNDPNGMVYYNGTYHLFFQYYPNSSVWGPMHWGHATSKDLVHWNEQPIAMYPDSIGCIFSGSAVVDKNNTSGFGINGKPPLVAIFTQHDFVGERLKTNTFQNQSIAYSNDEGKTWIKYSNNPVIQNPGIRDFRDPKVIWDKEANKWIMALATKDCVTFYSSKNLKEWTKETVFGKNIGAHGGVWECPDIFQLNDNGKKLWVLTVSLNPGAPNGGSGTQYFIGNFDGHTFTPIETKTKWLDYGPDNYASVTWSNTDNRIISLGWMSNWQYADKVPTNTWRSTTTIPRELSLKKISGSYYLSSIPINELEILSSDKIAFEKINAANFNLDKKIKNVDVPMKLHIQSKTIESFSIKLFNAAGENIIIGYDKLSNQYYIDRMKSGKINFAKGFARKAFAPRITEKKELDLTLVFDKTSVELFADDGLTVMTDIFFPSKPFHQIHIEAPSKYIFDKVEYTNLTSIWDSKK